MLRAVDRAYRACVCRALLPSVLTEEQFDWVVITSPEAAAVFLEGWRTAGEPDVHVAVVGKGTADALQGSGLEVQFVPPLVLPQPPVFVCASINSS